MRKTSNLNGWKNTLFLHINHFANIPIDRLKSGIEQGALQITAAKPPPTTYSNHLQSGYKTKQQRKLIKIDEKEKKCRNNNKVDYVLYDY